MKIAILILLVINPLFSQASDFCKANAQEALEISKKYRSYREAVSEFENKIAIVNMLPLTPETIDIRVENENKILTAEIVFIHLRNLKGNNLYKKVYDICVKQTN